MVQLYTYTCRIHIDAMNKRRATQFLEKYTSHFERFERVVCERGLETEQRLQYIEPHYSYGHQRCVFFVLQCCSAGGPRAQLSAECWLSLLHLVTNGSPNSLGVPRTPSAVWWLSLSHLVSNSPDLQLLDFLSSPSYIIVQSPTQSLEWHVWSSSSGNNCHAVHRSLSSGASVNECIMGFLPCPIFLAKPANTISSHNCHRNVSLPSGASLWNGMFGRVEGQYTTLS